LWIAGNLKGSTTAVKKITLPYESSDHYIAVATGVVVDLERVANFFYSNSGFAKKVLNH